MSTFPNFPQLVKGGLVLVDANTSAVLRIIALQYSVNRGQTTIIAGIVRV